jgi:hypothetical protein
VQTYVHVRTISNYLYTIFLADTIGYISEGINCYIFYQNFEEGPSCKLYTFLSLERMRSDFFVQFNELIALRGNNRSLG